MVEALWKGQFLDLKKSRKTLSNIGAESYTGAIPLVQDSQGRTCENFSEKCRLQETNLPVIAPYLI